MYSRHLNTAGFTRLEGTNGGSRPFWSPDSKSIGFFVGSRLKRVSVGGGGLLDICEVPQAGVATWGRLTILFAWRDIIYRVADTGGIPIPTTTLNWTDGEGQHLVPAFLPDGDRFLYRSLQKNGIDGRFYLDSLDRKQPRRLIPIRYLHSVSLVVPATLAPTLIFSLLRVPDQIRAYRFDFDRFKFIGEPQVLIASGANSLVFPGNGILVASWPGQLKNQLVWRDRTGKKLGTIATPGNYHSVFVAPDDLHIAVIRPQVLEALNPERLGIWMAPADGDQLEPFSSNYYANAAAWSPDGRTLYYSDPWQQRLMRRSLDSPRKDEVLVNLEDELYLSDVSTNLRYVAAELSGTSGKSRPRWMDLTLKKWQSIDASGPVGLRPTFSPDGKWLAFGSTHTGRSEIYVSDFPAGARRKRVSVDGGRTPLWRHDGRELFFIAEDGSLMSIPISPE